MKSKTFLIGRGRKLKKRAAKENTIKTDDTGARKIPAIIPTGLNVPKKKATTGEVIIKAPSEAARLPLIISGSRPRKISRMLSPRVKIPKSAS